MRACVGAWTLMLTLLLVGCQQSIRLAYVGPLSGPDHLYGKMESQAAQLALLNFNARASAGRQARLLLVDTAKTRTTKLVTRLRRKHHIQAIVGPPSSDLARVLTEQLEGNQMVMISASASNPHLTFKNPWFFRLQPSDELQSELMALFLIQKLEGTRTAVLYSQDNYGKPLAENFMASYYQAGGLIISNEREDGDAERQLTQLQLLSLQGEIDSLYLATDLASSRRVLTALQKIDLTGVTIVGSDAFSKLELRTSSLKGLDGVYYATAALHPEDENLLEQVLRDYHKVFQSQPDIYAMNAYDATTLLLTVIDQLEQAKLSVSGDDIRRAIAHLSKYTGVGGNISFNERGEVERGMALYRFLDGRPQYQGVYHIRAGKLVRER